MIFGNSIVSNQFIDQQKGLSIVNYNNLFVEICDQNNAPIDAELIVSGGSLSDGVYSGYSDYPLYVELGSDITFEVSKAGYSTASVTQDTIDGGFTIIKIIIESVSISFGCNTIFKNEFGATVTRPLTNGYVEVTFQASGGISENDYAVYFEAMPVGSSKYNSIVLDYELIDSGVDYLSYKVAVVQEVGDYCYISNIIKKRC